MSQDVNDLFQNAQAEGALSGASMQTLNLVDIGAQIQGALGIQAMDVQASEVVLVTLMMDDSGSIYYCNNTQHMIDGHSLIVDEALSGSKQKEGMLVHTRYLNGHILHPYVPIDQIVRMNSGNYDPQLGTPLYDQFAALLGTVIAKTQEFIDDGIPVRAITTVVTDGNDQHSTKIRLPSGIKPLVRDMLAQEGRHIIAAMGIDDGQTNFREVFGEMGIEDKWILTPGNTASEIRKAFQIVSRSTRQASQNAASFSKTALGGFGA